MANSLNLGYGSLAITVAQTGFTSLNGMFDSLGNRVETEMECVYEHTCSLSNLWIRITTNSWTGTTTFRQRKNLANANQVVSVAASTSGTFTDAVNTDSVAGGDKIDISYVTAAGTGTITFGIFSNTSTPSLNTVSRTGCYVLQIINTTGTLYFPPFGDGNKNTSPTTEANAKSRQRKAMTAKNFQITCVQNINASSATAGSRKNGANGNLTVSIPGNTTGNFEDKTHSDSLVAGDDFNFFSNTGGGNYETDVLLVEFVSTTQDAILSTASNNLQSVNTSVTDYWGLAGDLTTPTTTETKAQALVNSAFTFSELTINVQTNGITNASTITLRANAASAGVSASISASTTGVFSDSMNTYAAAATDLMNYQLVTAATGTSLKISHISVWTNLTPAVPTAGAHPQNFRNLVERPGAPKLKSQNVGPVFGI